MNNVVRTIKATTPEEIIKKSDELVLRRVAKARGISYQELAAEIADATNDAYEQQGYTLLKNKRRP
jgi:hypothetical protein